MDIAEEFIIVWNKHRKGDLKNPLGYFFDLLERRYNQRKGPKEPEQQKEPVPTYPPVNNTITASFKSWIVKAGIGPIQEMFPDLQYDLKKHKLTKKKREKIEKDPEWWRLLARVQHEKLPENTINTFVKEYK